MKIIGHIWYYISFVSYTIPCSLKPPYLCVEGVVDHLVAAEPLSGVDPGDHQDVGVARVNVHVLGFHVLADLVITQSLNSYQGFVVAKTPFLKLIIG